MENKFKDTSKDGIVGQLPMPFVYYVIVCLMPVTDSEALPNGEMPYEDNFFCRKLIDKASGVQFIEWDTDCSYAQRFRTSHGAENYLRVVLENMDGCIIKKHPFSL